MVNVLSHNDYAQERPLLDTLSYKINCVEVDIVLANNQLYVAHSSYEIEEKNTLEALYLKPLQAIISMNKGRVYANSANPFIIYVNNKTDENTLKIEETLSAYSNIISTFENGAMIEKPILIIGGKASDLINEKRFMVAEGTLEIEAKVAHTKVYMINLKWGDFFDWPGKGEMPIDELELLRAMVDTVHSQGRILRFWGNPDINTSFVQNFWDRVLGEGIHLLSTDYLKATADYLNR